MNPWRHTPMAKLRALTEGHDPDTLEGGRGVPDNQASSSLTSASGADGQSATRMLATALDALSAMFCGYLDRDRALLDEGFENLVGVLEEWRDAVPKIQE